MYTLALNDALTICNTDFPECRNAGMQSSGNAEFPECRFPGMQKCRNAEMPECRVPGMQRSRNAGLPECRVPGMQSSRNAEFNSVCEVFASKIWGVPVFFRGNSKR